VMQKPHMITAEQLEQDIDMDPAICMVKKFPSGPGQPPTVLKTASKDSLIRSNVTGGPSLDEASRSVSLQLPLLVLI
jgi:hypothetical protein